MRSMSVFRPLFLFLVLSFLVCSIVPASFAVSSEGETILQSPAFHRGGQMVADELLIKCRPGVPEDAVRELFQKHGVSEIRSRLRNRLRRVRVKSSRLRERMRARLSADSRVEYVQPNYFVFPHFVPDDTHYSYQWNFDQIGMESAWEESRGQGVVVAVVDSGCAYEDYDPPGTDRFVRLPDFAQTQFVQGYDFMEGDTHANDDHGHGSHVAGTIAQTTNNRYGVAGVAPEAELMPLKVFDKDGYGTSVELIEAIYFAVDNGADIINMSLGFPSEMKISDLPAVQDAVSYAANKGVILVASAGNDSSGSVGLPAGFPEVIAVGASNSANERAWYSNYGAALDLLAPGGDTVDRDRNGYIDAVLQQTIRNGSPTSVGLYFYYGTSMAAPHVSGVAALLLAQNPSLKPEEVRQILRSTAQDLEEPGWDEETGFGLLDAAAALQGVEPVDNRVPVAKAGGPYSGLAGEAVLFNGADSYDPDNDDLSYTWTFGDGDQGNGPTPSHVYEDGGKYAVSLVVSDSIDVSDSSATTATISSVNQPPVARAGADITVQDADRSGSERVRLDGSGSYDTDGSIRSYRWTEGSALLSQRSVDDVNMSVGVHTVTLLVEDYQGETGSDSLKVTVEEGEVPESPALPGSGLSVSLMTTDRYGNPQSVFASRAITYVVTAIEDGAPVRARVVLSVYQPDGSLAGMYSSYTSRSTGLYKTTRYLGYRAEEGTYTATVTATLSGYDPAQDTTTFVYQ
ncbi:MAG: S8 family serine peptidase [Candidatus Omnitrophica bacterium]|nr:S8 family serine peptidase [Candidatus Omnitrophota bacterium]